MQVLHLCMLPGHSLMNTRMFCVSECQCCSQTDIRSRSSLHKVACSWGELVFFMHCFLPQWLFGWDDLVPPLFRWWNITFSAMCTCFMYGCYYVYLLRQLPFTRFEDVVRYSRKMSGKSCGSVKFLNCLIFIIVLADSCSCISPHLAF